MTAAEPGRQWPPLCGATRPEGSNNPRPCVRAAHENGTHIDRQGVAWWSERSDRTDQLVNGEKPFGGRPDGHGDHRAQGGTG